MQGFTEKQKWTCSQLLKAGREWRNNFEREWPGCFPGYLDDIQFVHGPGGKIMGVASLFLEGHGEDFRDMCLEDIPKYPERLKRLGMDAKITKVHSRELLGFADESGSLCCGLGYVIDVDMTIKVGPQKKGAKSSSKGSEK